MHVLSSVNWLAEIGESDEGIHYISHKGELTVAFVQHAFDCIYGKGNFKVTSHGNVINVISYDGYVRQQVLMGYDEKIIREKVEKIKIMN